MRHSIRFALLAGTALAVSGCSRQAAPANNAAGEVGMNESLAAPGNDASAMESVANAPLPAAPAEANATNSAEPAPPPPSTPNVESNVAGM